jgi:hypothetical protein
MGEPDMSLGFRAFSLPRTLRRNHGPSGSSWYAIADAVPQYRESVRGAI